jgi:hypothetical protein
MFARVFDSDFQATNGRSDLLWPIITLDLVHRTHSTTGCLSSTTHLAYISPRTHTSTRSAHRSLSSSPEEMLRRIPTCAIRSSSSVSRRTLVSLSSSARPQNPVVANAISSDNKPFEFEVKRVAGEIRKRGLTAAATRDAGMDRVSVVKSTQLSTTPPN